MTVTDEAQATGLTDAAREMGSRLSAQDLLRLLEGTDVPGLDPDDPTVRVLREGLGTKVARTAFAMARQEGFLQVELGYGLYPDARVVEQLATVWGIWCGIREQPPIMLTVMPDGEGRLSCDLAAVEMTWTFSGIAVIGRLLEMKRPRPGCRWTFTTTLLEVSGLEAGDAVAMARGVVWLVRRGKERDEE